MSGKIRTRHGIGGRVALLSALLVGMATVAVAAPFDLTATAMDPNGNPLNPVWVWQQSHPNQTPDNANGAICSGHSWEAPCTSQPIEANDPGILQLLHTNPADDCLPPGHRNWEIATFTGVIYLEGHGDDDDYSINLYRPDYAALTVDSQPWSVPLGHGGFSVVTPTLHTEFNASETIDQFGSSWWTSFRFAVDNGYGASEIDGKDAIVIGLFGQDIKHVGNTAGLSELHPVLGLAIHVQNSQTDDEWALFVRNSGNEGPCSQQPVYWGATQITFFIPRAYATQVRMVSPEEWAHAPRDHAAALPQATGPNIALVVNQGALVTFNLPPPENRVSLDTVFHLVWTTNPPPPFKGAEEEETELANHRLTPAQIAAYNKAVPRRKPCNIAVVHGGCVTSAALKATVTANLRFVPQPPSPAAFTQAIDPEAPVLDKAKLDALKKALSIPALEH
jgi:hypothetical protein